MFDTGMMIADADVHMLRILESMGGMSTQPTHLVTGCNSGHQAVNVASLAGAAPIYLLGFDAKRGPNGEKHDFGDHPDKTEAPYANMEQSMRSAAKFFTEQGVKVYNCSPDSALNMFEKKPLLEALNATI